MLMCWFCVYMVIFFNFSIIICRILHLIPFFLKKKKTQGDWITVSTFGTLTSTVGLYWLPKTTVVRLRNNFDKVSMASRRILDCHIFKLCDHFSSNLSITFRNTSERLSNNHKGLPQAICDNEWQIARSYHRSALCSLRSGSDHWCAKVHFYAPSNEDTGCSCRCGQRVGQARIIASMASDESQE